MEAPTAPSSSGEVTDQLDSRDSPRESHPDGVIAQHNNNNLHRSLSSPGLYSEPGGELAEDLHNRNNLHDAFRSGAHDQRHFDPMAAASMMNCLGQENDDLPLVFSLAGGSLEDDASKVYSCHLCSFRTAFKNSLVNHQAVHSDARPWVCEICDYAAKRKQDLKKHLQTMHGMVVDSLSLQMGSCAQSCASSAGLSSPTDTKPVLVSNTVFDESGGCAAVGSGGSRVDSSGALAILQQPSTGSRQTLTSSAMLSPSSRSATSAGKAKETTSAFQHAQNDEKAANRFVPKSSTVDTCQTVLKSEFRKASDSGHSSSSSVENFLLKKMQGFKEERFFDSCSKNTDSRSYRLSDGNEGRKLPSVRNLLPKWGRRYSCSAEEYASINTSTAVLQNNAQHSETFGSEGTVKSTFGSEGTVRSSLGSGGIARSTFDSEGIVRSTLGSEGIVRSTLGSEGTASSTLGSEGIVNVRSTFGSEGTVRSTFGSEGIVRSTLGSEGIVRSETVSSNVAVSPSSGATDGTRRQKRTSVNSDDWTPVKTQRFQSPSSESDVECSPQVSSQSDLPIISSTVAHSRDLETKKSFHCAHCDIVFFESAMYLMHAGLHDRSNPWKCSVCGRTFFEKYSFTSHFINQH